MNTVVITGASSGIGAECKRQLTAEGHRVINIDLRDGDVNADLATAEGREMAIAEIHRLCPEGIDGLVCCAGVSGACGNFRLMIALNFYGAVSVAAGLFDLLQKKKGHCVLISTFAVAQGYNIMDLIKLMQTENSEEAVLAAVGAMDNNDLGLGSAVYATAKYAVSLWVRRHAASWGARGVHINSVAPGTTNTPMIGTMNDAAMAALSGLQIPIKFGASLMLDTEEVADVILFLLSRKSRAIHGALIFADGGMEPAINTERVY